MSATFKLSQLIFNNENPYYIDKHGNTIRHLTLIENIKDIKGITTPDGKELTPEELFDFVIGNNITDLARTKNVAADVAIVLGNIELPTTRERAIKAFELYKLGIVKKIIFTGGISKERDKRGLVYFDSQESYMNNELIKDLEWNDFPEADWGAETFVRHIFDKDYNKHSSKLTVEFLNSIGVNPEDVLTEAMSKTTQENAEFCKNIFDIEEIETGEKISSAILVTTCTHGNRALRQFEKVFGDKISLKWCPSTLDLEQYETLKLILMNPNFDDIGFKKELKRLYCTIPELTQLLREEVAHTRNVFIKYGFEEPIIKTDDTEPIHR